MLNRYKCQIFSVEFTIQCRLISGCKIYPQAIIRCNLKSCKQYVSLSVFNYYCSPDEDAKPFVHQNVPQFRFGLLISFILFNMLTISSYFLYTSYAQHHEISRTFFILFRCMLHRCTTIHMLVDILIVSNFGHC